jgi:hypothetical protein
MENTLNLKHTRPKSNQFDLKDPLINDLIMFIDLKKANIEENAYLELNRMMNDPDIISLFDEKTKKQIINKISCSLCQKPRFKQLSCRCFLCLHQHNDLAESIQKLLQERDFESFEEMANLISCPNCSRKLIQSDLESLIPEIQDQVESHLRISILKKVELSGTFNCSSCKKIRGKFLLPDQNAHPCLHMCLFCIFSSYSKDKSKNCSLCKSVIQMNLLFPLRSQCFECRQEFYFGGDRMIEIDPGVILCPNCSYIKLLNRFCDFSNRNLSLAETLEYYFYLFKVCWKCETEVFIEELEQKRCCFNYFCRRCLSNSVNCCPKCHRAD